MPKICVQFSDTVSHKIDFTALGLHKDQPLAWELSEKFTIVSISVWSGVNLKWEQYFLEFRLGTRADGQSKLFPENKILFQLRIRNAAQNNLIFFGGCFWRYCLARMGQMVTTRKERKLKRHLQTGNSRKSSIRKNFLISENNL